MGWSCCQTGLGRGLGHRGRDGAVFAERVLRCSKCVNGRRVGGEVALGHFSTLAEQGSAVGCVCGAGFRWGGWREDARLSEVTELCGQLGYLCPGVAWAPVSGKVFLTWERPSGGGWLWHWLRGERWVHVDRAGVLIGRVPGWLALLEERSRTHGGLGTSRPLA